MKKIRNKKAFIAVSSLLLIITIGVTFAVFNSVSTKENEFNVGNYGFITMESFESPTDWLPGETIDKTIYGMNNGDIPVAFRIKYEERWEDASGDPISNVPNDAVTINFVNQNHWSYNSNDGYYYHKYFIAASDSSCTLISGITLNENLMGSASCEMVGDTYTCTSDLDGLAGAKYIVTFTKEAVAYNKYQEFWNTDEVITEEPPLVQILNSERTKDNLQAGDEICINGETTECFNFIRYDGNNDENIVMLAEWNLKVGDIYEGSHVKTGEYTSSDIGYGLQSSEVKGYKYEEPTRNGVVAFSNTNYWYDGSGLKPKYGSDWKTGNFYDNNVYDSDYNDASENNYSIAYYVENYKDILETYGLTVQSARLLTYRESIENVGCSIGTGCPSSVFISNTSFWFGSAMDDRYITYVSASGNSLSSYYDYVDDLGVRPVIVISKSELE